MAKAKLKQIKLASGYATQPPFPGGWVLAVFDALSAFALALAHEHALPGSKRTRERIKAAEAVKQRSYDEVEVKLVDLITSLFPNVSNVNGFAKKYVDEYFGLWKQAAEWSPKFAKCLGFKPRKPSVLGRALVRDLILRLCYLECCERKLSGMPFGEAELSFLRHDNPTQVYQVLMSERARSGKLSQKKLADELATTEKPLFRVKRGKSLPSFNLLLRLKPSNVGHRLLAGIGFVDHLVKSLGFRKSELHNEFMSIASVFLRNHPPALKAFKGSIFHKTDSGLIKKETRDFEGYVAYGDYLLLHLGFNELHPEMPDALWRAHLHTLQYARFADLAQAYFQFGRVDNDRELTSFLDTAERNSDSCPYHWMDELRKHNNV